MNNVTLTFVKVTYILPVVPYGKWRTDLPVLVRSEKYGVMQAWPCCASIINGELHFGEACQDFIWYNHDSYMAEGTRFLTDVVEWAPLPE